MTLATSFSRAGAPATDGLLIGGLATLWLIAAFFPPLNADAGAILAFADRMVGGQRLYIDLIDINPPLIFWLTCLPAGLARLLGMSSVPVFLGFVALWQVAGLALAWLLLRHDPDRLQARLFMAATACVLLILPGQSFGQREHLMMAAVLPYGVLAAHRLDGRRTAPVPAATAAAFAMLGIMLKPHFVLLPLAVELVLLARRGRSALAVPAPWIMLALGLAYLVVTALAAPAYFRDILPLASENYGVLAWSVLPDLLAGEQMPRLIVILPVLALAAGRTAAPLPRIAVALALGATLAGLLQFKDWDYHFLPARGLTILAAAMVLGTFVRERLPGLAVSLAVLPAVALGGGFDLPLLPQREFKDSEAGRTLALVRERAEGRPVLWLTQYIDPTSPVLNYTRSELAMPYMSMWLLPALYPHPGVRGGEILFRPAAARGSAERDLLERIGASLAGKRPALVLIDRDEGEAAFRGAHFDYLAYFRQDPRFAAEWGNYRYLTSIETTDIYARQ